MYLNVREVQEVLGDVNNKLVHESWGEVKSSHCVVEIVSTHAYIYNINVRWQVIMIWWKGNE